MRNDRRGGAAMIGAVVHAALGALLLCAGCGDNWIPEQDAGGEAALVSVEVTPAAASAAAGRVAVYAAQATYSDGVTRDVTGEATWTIDDAQIGELAAGRATAHGQGATHVHAVLGAASGSAALTVTAAEVDAVAVVPAAVSVPVGAHQAFHAFAQMSDGGSVDVTDEATWRSSQPGTLAIAATGEATGVADGAATVTATLAALPGTAGVTVVAAPLVAVEVDGPGILPVGLSTPLVALGAFGGGLSHEITADCGWASSDDAILSVSTALASAGIATAHAPGTVTITATCGALSAQISIGVAAQCHVLINEVKTGSLLQPRDEFVELHNPCGGPLDLAGVHLVYRGPLATIDQPLAALTGTLAPGGYLVISGASGLATDLSALGGGIALRDANNVLLDTVGYGVATNIFVQLLAAVAPGLGQSIGRDAAAAPSGSSHADFTLRLVPSPGVAN